jgi:hypothetical protein
MEAIRRAPKYALAVWGFRFILVALPCFVVFMALGMSGVTSIVALVPAMLFVVFAVPGMIFMAAAAIGIMPKTTRYIGGTKGRPPDLRRFAVFMRALWSDAIGPLRARTAVKNHKSSKQTKRRSTS